MAFDQSSVSDVRAYPHDADLLITWTSTAPVGTRFQVYVGGRLTWSGVGQSCVVPVPQRRVTIDVGTVGAAEAATNFSASLPAVPGGGDRATLSWRGGTYLDPTIDRFEIYDEPGPGVGIDYGLPVATVPAYPGGIVQDGYGLGGYDEGGFGATASDYSWTSGPLSAGTWSFAVKGVDRAGNVGAVLTQSVSINVPPRPPAAAADRTRARISTYNPGTRIATIDWGLSPTAGARYHIYRNTVSGGSIDYTAPVVTIISGTTWTTPALSVNFVHRFGVRAFDAISTLEERNTDATATLATDAAGADITRRPNAPSSLAVRATVAGTARVTWTYNPAGQGGAPTGFHVYQGTPTVSYGSPVATVAYVAGRVTFAVYLTGLADGVVYQVGVRAYNMTAEEPNPIVVSVTGDVVGPAAVENLMGVAS